MIRLWSVSLYMRGEGNSSLFFVPSFTGCKTWSTGHTDIASDVISICRKQRRLLTWILLNTDLPQLLTLTPKEGFSFSYPNLSSYWSAISRRIDTTTLSFFGLNWPYSQSSYLMLHSGTPVCVSFEPRSLIILVGPHIKAASLSAPILATVCLISSKSILRSSIRKENLSVIKI